jgi:hypothetical protein
LAAIWRSTDTTVQKIDSQFEKECNCAELFDLTSAWLLSGNTWTFCHAWPSSGQPLSLVGTLSSDAFESSSIHFMPNEKTFIGLIRLFTWTASRLYIEGRYLESIGASELADIEEEAYGLGSAILEQLDRVLSADNLNKSPRSVLQIIFLSILSFLLGTGYIRELKGLRSSTLFNATQISNKPSMASKSPFGSPESLWILMSKHVCEMLAHYLIIIGCKLGVPFRCEAQERMIVQAAIQWARSGAFIFQSSNDPVRPDHGQNLHRTSVSNERSCDGCGTFGVCLHPDALQRFHQHYEPRGDNDWFDYVRGFDLRNSYFASQQMNLSILEDDTDGKLITQDPTYEPTWNTEGTIVSGRTQIKRFKSSGR